MKQIPVTIITGFLGSGKTSLLNNIIKKYNDKRLAIIENEFGEINIDADLIVGAEKGSVFELSNGCICCSMNNDLYETLENLLKIRHKFDHLIVETTGIADPLTVVKSFISTPAVADNFDIDSVICVVDAPIFEELMDEQEEPARQLVMADIVVINKVDLVTPGYLDALKGVIHRLNPSAAIYATSYAKIYQNNLLSMNAYAGRQIEMSATKYINTMPLKSMVNFGGFASSLTQKILKHDIQSYSFTFLGDFDFDKFSIWMESFFYFSSSRVFRVKGVIAFRNKGNKVFFHSVKGAFMLEEGPKWNDSIRQSKLVFIGKHLDSVELNKALEMLLVK